MPMYEYKCPLCGYTVELLQRFDAPPPKEDHTDEQGTSCSGQVTRQLSLSSFALKGGGWYKDGY